MPIHLNMNELIKKFSALLRTGKTQRYLIQYASVLSLLLSTQAHAVGNFVLQQSPTQITVGVYVVGIVIAIFLAVSIFQSVVSRTRKKALSLTNESHEQHQESMPLGLLHLNLDGKVAYANQPACKLLGRLTERLINKPLSSCFSGPAKEQIEACLLKRQSSIKLKAQASNLFLNVSFGDLYTKGSNQHIVVCLSDENRITRDYVDVTNRLEKHENMVNVMRLGQLWIDLEEQKYYHDKCFDKLLTLDQIQHSDSEGITATEKMPLQELNDRIHPNDGATWSKALHKAKEEGCAKANIRMLENVSNNTKKYRAVLVNVSSQTKSIDSIEKNNDTQAYILHLSVLDVTDIDNHQQALDEKSLQHQAVLNTSTDAIYSVDKLGNLLWSNASFNALYRSYATHSKTNNIFESGFLPEDLVKVMQNSPGLSGRNYEAEFELNQQDSQSAESHKVYISLRYSFFANKDRLSDKTEYGIVGVLQNVSELVKTRRAMVQEREQVEKMLSYAPVAIATIDKDDCIINANSVMSRRLGFSDVELKKQDFYQLFDDPKEAGKAAKSLFKTGHLRDFHAILKGKDKKLHPSELHIDLINKEKQEYLCWIADRSDEQFQQDKFDSLLEHSSMPMAILGERGFSKLNDQAVKFFCVNEETDLYGVSPYSHRLNSTEDNASALKQIIDEVKASGKAKSFTWEHQAGDYMLPCQATYVPMYKEQDFDSLLCIWIDKRELQKADSARQQAIDLQQAAMLEVKEKQAMLDSSQNQLASKTRTLADTEQKLQTVEESLTTTKYEYQHLQQEHRFITDNLNQLKTQYGHSREMLADAQKVNADLSEQLASSTEKVEGLHSQREAIAEALKSSEEKYKLAQEQLVISQQNAQELEQQQDTQQQKMHALVNQIDTMKQSVADKDTQINQVSEQINVLQSQLASSSVTKDKLREQLNNQRKASEKAQSERRKIEQNCQLAEAELRNKERHLDHLKREMEKLEEMSTQEKGDMQAQQSALKLELENKLQQLQNTQMALSNAQKSAELDKQEKANQQALLAKVQKELLEVEHTAHQKQLELEQKEQEKRKSHTDMQQKLWSELKAKQLKLQETEQILQQAKQQTESEKAEKEKQQKLFEQLKIELLEIEKRNTQQQEKMAASDKQWSENKDQLKQEVHAKREQLAETKRALDEIQQQADKERLIRIEQEQKLAQLTVELSDVETRANKQKEMLEGSDEQWRNHHAQIEQQKQQLQQALHEAQQQNEALESQLNSKLDALQVAEKQVDKTQSGEHALQKDLDNARQQADDLQSKISQQESKEQQLQQQLQSQQNALESKESSINALQQQQQLLKEELVAVQKEYAKSKQTLSIQHQSHSDLNGQMGELESALEHSKKALADKESALQAAQQALEASQNKLQEKEQALLSAHKQELEQATQKSDSDVNGKPEIERLPLPEKPAVWFDLLPYLKNQPNLDSLPVALTELMNDLQFTITDTEKAVENNDTRGVLASSKRLVSLSQKINSDALTYLMSSIENDCANGMVDNVSIRWPATKQGLQKTLRVVYSHLHA